MALASSRSAHSQSYSLHIRGQRASTPTHLARAVQKVVLILNVHCLGPEQAACPQYLEPFSFHRVAGILNIGKAIADIGPKRDVGAMQVVPGRHETTLVQEPPKSESRRSGEEY
jgi:hypothetical protein